MSISLKGTLVLIGAGKMGGAMLEGWLKAGVEPRLVVALDPGLPPKSQTSSRPRASVTIRLSATSVMRKCSWRP